jgi:TRAP-type uncharacterized transport system fused permease subunit
MFCYYPSLLLLDTTLGGLFFGLFSSFVGVTCLSAASIGYFFGPLRLWQRLIMFIGTALVIHPSAVTDILGVLIILAVFGSQKYFFRAESKGGGDPS